MNVVNTCNGLCVGVLQIEGIRVGPSPEWLVSEIKTLINTGNAVSPDLKKEVRDMLRRWGFKPSGRNRPASEYLWKAAEKGDFPIINNLVDINNLVSLETGLPISLLDRDVLGDDVLIRVGKPGETYVFNPSGQKLDLEGLVVICRKSDNRPLGTPIKDSMDGKITEDTNGVVYFVYGPLLREQLVNTALDRIRELTQKTDKNVRVRAFFIVK